LRKSKYSPAVKPSCGARASIGKGVGIPEVDGAGGGAAVASMGCEGRLLEMAYGNTQEGNARERTDGNR